MRDLRNDVSRILRRVEHGERFTVTVRGKPVADLVPHHVERRRFIPRDELVTFLSSRRPDPTLREEIRRLIPDTTDDHF